MDFEPKKSNIFFIGITFILLISFIFFDNLNSKAVIIVFLSIFLIIVCIKFFYTGCIINILLLIYLPFMLIQDNMLINKDKTFTLIFILCTLFLTSIFNFLILSYNINNNDNKLNFYVTSILNKPFFKILCIFFLYLSILFSVIDSFAILYTNLSNIFNEGIIGKDEIFSHLDALYFSTTTFFTIGFGDICPSEYSEITKRLVIIQAMISHIITTVLWPVAIILYLVKAQKKYLNSKTKNNIIRAKNTPKKWGIIYSISIFLYIDIFYNYLEYVLL